MICSRICTAPQSVLESYHDRVMDSQPKPVEKVASRWRAALDAGHAAVRFCNRVIGWNRIGLALSLAIIAIAAVVLFRILRDIDVRDVVQAVRDTDTSTIALAALFVACGYFTLTFYDLFALRTIGRPDVPYWGAAFAGFTSYSVGHNV